MAKVKKGVIMIGNTKTIEATQEEVQKAVKAMHAKMRKADDERKAREEMCESGR